MRVFLALVPPAPVRRALIDRMHGLAGARWQRDDQLHVTMRFVGEADRHACEALMLALRRDRFAPVAARLDGFGSFDRRGATDQLWAGLAPRDRLAALHARLDRLCVMCGFAPEARRFMPHITLARFARSQAPDTARLAAWMAGQPPLAADPIAFDRLALMQSHLGKDGSVYEVLLEMPLAG